VASAAIVQKVVPTAHLKLKIIAILNQRTFKITDDLIEE
jgi:hypothetical protein